MSYEKVNIDIAIYVHFAVFVQREIGLQFHSPLRLENKLLPGADPSLLKDESMCQELLFGHQKVHINGVNISCWSRTVTQR